MGSSLTAVGRNARGALPRAKDATNDRTWAEPLPSPAAAPRRAATGSPRRPAVRGQIVTGRAGDHPAVHRLLLTVLHRPQEAEFQFGLDRPGYHPSDRLLLLRDQDLVAHVRLICRPLRFAQAWLPTCDLTEFACLPEYRLWGDHATLLAAAEAKARSMGAVLATTWTHEPDAFAACGWIPRGGSRCLRTSPRNLLSRLSFLGQTSTPARRANGRAPKLNVRPWRYVEQQALIDLYDRYARSVYGAPRRDAAYWEWLLVRRGYDQILVVAHAAADSSESFAASCQSIVGYAFVRGSDVVELVVSPEWPQAPGHLLRRVASDALERDEHAVRLFHPAMPDSIWNPPPPNATCGEDLRPTSSQQPRQFVKVLDPLGFLQCSAGALASRARHNGDGSCLNLRLDRRRIRVEVHADHVHLADARPSRQEVRACGAGVSALLLGCLPLDPATADGAVHWHDAATHELVRHLFPPQPLWRSTLDDLPSLVG